MCSSVICRMNPRLSHSQTLLKKYPAIIFTAKNQYRKFETNNPRKEIARPQSQFPHSCVCERFTYSHYRSAYSAAGNMWNDPRNILIAHRLMNVENGIPWGRAIPRKGIHKWNFRCSVWRHIHRKLYWKFGPFERNYFLISVMNSKWIKAEEKCCLTNLLIVKNERFKIAMGVYRDAVSAFQDEFTPGTHLSKKALRETSFRFVKADWDSAV